MHRQTSQQCQEIAQSEGANAGEQRRKQRIPWHDLPHSVSVMKVHIWADSSTRQTL